MSQPYLMVKEGRPVFGYATRNPDTYEEGEYRVFLYKSPSRRDRAAEREERFMPEVKRFDIDIAKVVGLT